MIIFYKVFFKFGKVKYSNIYFFVVILSVIYCYYNEFVISVIDIVIEFVVFGFE